MVARILFLLCFVILPISHTKAQNNHAPSKKRSSDRATIKSLYDPQKDETSVVVYPYLRVETNNTNLTEVISLTAGFTYLGQVLTAPPKNIEFGLITHSPYKWQFKSAKDRELEVMVEGEQIILITLDRVEFRTIPDNSVTTDDARDPSRLYFQEKLAGFLPSETFQKIAIAKKVILKLGGYDSKLSKEHLKVLSELASKMKP